ncbi:MAG: MFS transporter [Candidatus Methanomethylophilaceae archaeon]|nr:MFS transporter [Candidatus Methanomethylophilaceae archaeon]MDY0225160.1 MFS transporter [Candidatus Methanomethylophilaceae archaeon]
MDGGSYSDKDCRNLLFATCLGAAITPLMGTMISLALPCIGKDFDASTHSLSMINTIFLIASVMFMVPVARFASIYGMKKTSIIGLIIVITSAVLSALSPDLEFLLAMRFILGAGSSVLMVTGIAMLSTVYPAQRRGWAIGIYTAVTFIGFTLGPSIGGTLSDLMGWRVLFLLMVPLSVLSLMFFRRFDKDISPMHGKKMDMKGSFLWMDSILVIMLGVAYVTEPWGIILILLGSALLITTFHFLRNRENPVLNVKLFHICIFRRSCIAAFMNYAAASSLTFFLALYLQSIGQMTASEAGLIMMLQPFIQAIFTVWAGSLSDKIEDGRILPTAGMGMICIGSLMMVFIGSEISLIYISSVLFMFGMGIALFAAPNTSIIISSVSREYRGEASGMVSVFRQTGMMISMGIAMICISIFMGSSDNISPSTYGAFMDSIHTAFLVCFIICLTGAFVSWFRGETSKFCYI